MAASRGASTVLKVLRIIFGLIVRVAVLMATVVIFYVVISIGFDFGHDLFAGETVDSKKEAKEVVFEVKEGESLATITKNLKEAGLIKSEMKYRCLLVFFDKSAQPGEYTFNTSMTSKEIMKILNTGPEVSEE